MKQKIICLILAVSLSIGFMSFNASAAPIPLIAEGEVTNKVCANSANIFNDINWNFESSSHNGEYYWNMVNTIDGLGSAYFYVMSVVDDKAHDGKRSMLLDGVGGWANIVIPINVKKNTQYTFSMWVNASPGLGGKQNSIFKFGSLTGNKIDSMPAKAWGGDNGLGEYDGEWHHVAVTLNTLDNDQIALLFADGGGTIYFDELRFFETAKPNEKAETKVANLDAVLAHYESEANKTDKPSANTTTAIVTGNGDKTNTPNESDVTATENTEDTTILNGDITSSTANDNKKTDVSSSTKAVNNNNTKKNNFMWVFIVLGIIILVGGGSAIWYFVIRKNKENIEDIENK